MTEYSAANINAIVKSNVDLVEVTHAWDPSGRTGITAAWVIREALLAWWGS